jgi:hypothetical protein
LSAPRKASPFKLMFGVDASSPAMRKDGLHHGVGLAPEALAMHAEATSRAGLDRNRGSDPDPVRSEADFARPIPIRSDPILWRQRCQISKFSRSVP